MSGMASYTPGMEISGGSLGHGLTVAARMGLGLRYRGNDARVYGNDIEARQRRRRPHHFPLPRRVELDHLRHLDVNGGSHIH